MRLIDADALWMEVIHTMDYCDDVLEIIEHQKTIEPTHHNTPNTLKTLDCVGRQEAIEKFAMTAPQMSVIHIYEAVEILESMPSAQPKLSENTTSEQPKMNKLGVKTGETCTDAIYRHDAVDAMCAIVDGCESDDPYRENPHIDVIIDTLENLPSAQPELDEWCYDCKEYDADRHSCPRWNRVIRQTVEEAKIIHCKDCKHWMNEHLCKKLSAYYGSIDTDAYFFCGYAERRSE